MYLCPPLASRRASSTLRSVFAVLAAAVRSLSIMNHDITPSKWLLDRSPNPGPDCPVQHEHLCVVTSPRRGAELGRGRGWGFKKFRLSLRILASCLPLPRGVWSPPALPSPGPQFELCEISDGFLKCNRSGDASEVYIETVRTIAGERCSGRPQWASPGKAGCCCPRALAWPHGWRGRRRLGSFSHGRGLGDTMAVPPCLVLRQSPRLLRPSDRLAHFNTGRPSLLLRGHGAPSQGERVQQALLSCPACKLVLRSGISPLRLPCLITLPLRT